LFLLSLLLATPLLPPFFFCEFASVTSVSAAAVVFTPLHSCCIWPPSMLLLVFFASVLDAAFAVVCVVTGVSAVAEVAILLLLSFVLWLVFVLLLTFQLLIAFLLLLASLLILVSCSLAISYTNIQDINLLPRTVYNS
jgi:hypothetical protein